MVISQKDIISAVTIAALGSCDKVVYTLDGSEPMADSTPYTGPVVLAERESHTILKARCMLAGRLVGSTLSAEFCGIPKPDVFLDELSLVRMKSGNQSLQTQMRKNCIGKPIQMGGAEFSHGIGDHAGKDFAAELVYALKPEYKRFVSLVGVDDQTAGKGSIRVHIYVDDQLKTETAILKGRQAPVSLDVELPKGGKELRIVIDDAGDGYAYDDADFANAGFIVR